MTLTGFTGETRDDWLVSLPYWEVTESDYQLRRFLTYKEQRKAHRETPLGLQMRFKTTQL